MSITGSSPYSARHYQTPIAPRPGEHYVNPENPLLGVARHLAVTASLKQAVPQLRFVGGGYSYRQQFLPHVAESRVRHDQVDLIGIGRMHLAVDGRRVHRCSQVGDRSSTSATSDSQLHAARTLCSRKAWITIVNVVNPWGTRRIDLASGELEDLASMAARCQRRKA